VSGQWGLHNRVCNVWGCEMVVGFCRLSRLIENGRLFDVRLPPTTQRQSSAFEVTTVDVYQFACLTDNIT